MSKTFEASKIILKPVKTNKFLYKNRNSYNSNVDLKIRFKYHRSSGKNFIFAFLRKSGSATLLSVYH